MRPVQLIYLQPISCNLRLNNYWQSGENKNCLNQRNREFVVRLSQIFLFLFNPLKGDSISFNVRSYTHKVSPPRLPEHELNKDNNERQARVDGGKSKMPHPYTKNCVQLRNDENKRQSFRGSHQFMIQYQVVRPENIHTNSII